LVVVVFDWNIEMHDRLLATKVGMTQLYLSDGRIAPVTVLSVGPCSVGVVRTKARDGYDGIQICLTRDGNVAAIRESRIDPAERQYEPGQSLDAPFISLGSKVDVIGTSKGRGYQGVMKRHGFSGLWATHGVKKVHRSQGSTGQNTHPGRVHRGTKMPGQYGAARVTVRNLVVHSFDQESGVLAVGGSVPGPNGALVVVRKQIEK